MMRRECKWPGINSEFINPTSYDPGNVLSSDFWTCGCRYYLVVCYSHLIPSLPSYC